MRLNPSTLLLLCSLIFTAVLAWEKIDHEIFELYDDIKRNEATTDWYELLGIGPKSSVGEINSAYRQLSKKYHPDKRRNKDVEVTEAEEKRFQRIGLVVAILRDKYSRKRYNFFRKNGVPTWRGTGYLYRRWRPGFGTVVAGLLVFVSAMQYLFQKLSYWRAQERIKILEEEQAKLGSKLKVRRADEQGTKQANRRMRRQQQQQQQNGSGKGSPTNTDYEDSGFEGEDLEPSQLNTVGVINPYSVKPASIKRVLIVSLPLWAVTSLLSAVGLYKKPEEAAEDADVEIPAETTEDGRTGADLVRLAAEGALAQDEKNASYNKDAEAKAKKASAKAKKLEARRRRTPVV